jgi:eukaryotic-like serine/threonine-protein kinase
VPILGETNGWAPPEVFEEYRVVRLLGQGAMGVVYLAQDTLLDRPVAVKFTPKIDAVPHARERFFREARALARIQHPHVVSIYRVGELDGRPFIVYELIRGQALDRTPRPMPESELLQLAVGLSRGLAAVHRAAMVHRDIKPANVIFAPGGQAKLVDFGVAKLLESEGTWEDRTAWLSSFDADARATLIEEALVGSSDALTMPGGIVGTPGYIAPEVWLGAPASTRSDVYSMGVMLYEVASGVLPNSGEPIKMLVVARSMGIAPLSQLVPKIDPRLAAIIDRCVKPDPIERYSSADELREALEELSAKAERPRGRRAQSGQSPYRGLYAFDAEHQDLFYGREPEIRSVLERLRYEPWVIIAGDSGVGKSSLCRAGVLPPVREGALSSSGSWSVITMVPGPYPLAALHRTLAPLAGSELATKPTRESINEAFRSVLLSRTNLVVFVDQLEELVTMSSAGEAEELMRTLVDASTRTGTVKLLATVRSDFLTRVASVPGLEEMSRALFLLRSLSPSALRTAIVEPASVQGVRFESAALVDTLVQTATRTSGGLPLLQFALNELWDTIEPGRSVITQKGLTSIGGVDGALGRYADRVLDSLAPAERAMARRVLMRLVTSEGTRSVLTNSEVDALGQGARATIDALVRARLLTARDSESGPVYELAHEALVEGWATLGGWLASDAERHRAEERIRRAANEWHRLRDPELLLTGRQVAETASLELEHLGEIEREFVKASSSRARMKKVRAFGLLFGLLVLLALVAYAGSSSARLEREHRVSVRFERGDRMLAEASRGHAATDELRARAFERFDAGDELEGEARWKSARERARSVTASLSVARRELEGALAIDSSRMDVRQRLVESEFLRAQIAERDSDEATLEDALARLREWDSTSKELAELSAPATLLVRTGTVRAEVKLARYQQHRDQTWPLASATDLGTTPASLDSIPPGSYLLTVSAKDFAPVRYPILLARGEKRVLDLELLESSRVPDGFVHIPAGEFLVGSAADDRMRRTHEVAAPIHPAKTGPFLIARYETTHADWAKFLADVGDAAPGAWAKKRKKIRSGSPDDRLPVERISVDDARAYVAWLSRTDRVPRARLCSELEWERAARGADDRAYPHGDAIGPEDAAFSSIETPSKERPVARVGTHPVSRSPFGIDDLAGNLWEIVESPIDPDNLVIRGGGWFSRGEFLVVSLRQLDERGQAYPGVGIRVCADVR